MRGVFNEKIVLEGFGSQGFFLPLDPSDYGSHFANIYTPRPNSNF